MFYTTRDRTYVFPKLELHPTLLHAVWPSGHLNVIKLKILKYLYSLRFVQSLKRRCRGKYYGNIDSSNTECLKEFQGYEEVGKFKLDEP